MKPGSHACAPRPSPQIGQVSHLGGHTPESGNATDSCSPNSRCRLKDKPLRRVPLPKRLPFGDPDINTTWDLGSLRGHGLRTDSWSTTTSTAGDKPAP